MKRVAYISGPIAGHDEGNESMFRAAERRLTSERNLRKWQYDLVLVPHDIPPNLHDGPCPASYVTNGDHSAACYLRTDLKVMLELATDVWFLPGWEASVGARLEMQVAAACGLRIHFFHKHDLGCVHNEHGWGKCDGLGCWNYRKPLDQVHTAEEVAAAVRRPGEPGTVQVTSYPGATNQLAKEKYL